MVPADAAASNAGMVEIETVVNGQIVVGIATAVTGMVTATGERSSGTATGGAMIGVAGTMMAGEIHAPTGAGAAGPTPM